MSPPSTSGVSRGAVFLDRDGTLIHDVGYLSRPEQVMFYPWSLDAIRALNRAGLKVAIVTNQSGVARGYFSVDAVEAVHRHIDAQLAAAGVRIDAYYYCPHHPEGRVAAFAQACECRKPGRGLVDRAAADLGIDPGQSFVVGDRWVDVALARTIGARGVLVRTGYGDAEAATPIDALSADAVVDNLIEAVGWILKIPMLIPRSVHPLPGESERKERLLSLVDGFSSRSIVVVGDVLADEFVYGEVARISREAPVLILKYDATEVVPGGAGNAANNVASLGGRASLAGLVGADSEGRRLLASFPRSIDCRRVVRARGYRTPVKTRILAGGVHSSKQQVVRIDRDSDWPLSEQVSRTFAKKLSPALSECDAVILSDYGSGLITPSLAASIRAALDRRSRRRPVPVLVDSRYGLLAFRGLTTCTPNQSEVEAVLGVRIDDDVAALERAGRAILRRTGMKAVLVTRGSRGMALFQPSQATIHVPIFGSDEVADVTGAGDTVIAAFGLALSAGASFYEAARLANYAGGIVVMKRGTATVSARELSDAIISDHDTEGLSL